MFLPLSGINCISRLVCPVTCEKRRLLMRLIRIVMLVRLIGQYLVIMRMVVCIFTEPVEEGFIISCMSYIIVETGILRIVLIVILVFVG